MHKYIYHTQSKKTLFRCSLLCAGLKRSKQNNNEKKKKKPKLNKTTPPAWKKTAPLSSNIILVVVRGFQGTARKETSKEHQSKHFIHRRNWPRVLSYLAHIDTDPRTSEKRLLDQQVCRRFVATREPVNRNSKRDSQENGRSIDNRFEGEVSKRHCSRRSTWDDGI